MAKQDQNNSKKQGQSNQVAPIPLDQLPADLRHIVEALPQDRRGEAVRYYASIKYTSTHTGPLPAPETLAGYNNILPGSADRILTMAEKQQDHRIDLEKTSVRRQYNQSSTGQWMAFALSILFLGVGGFLIYEDHDTSGAVIITTTLVGLVAVFISGKVQIGKSLKEKE